MIDDEHDSHDEDNHDNDRGDQDRASQSKPAFAQAAPSAGMGTGPGQANMGAGPGAARPLAAVDDRNHDALLNPDRHSPLREEIENALGNPIHPHFDKAALGAVLKKLAAAVGL